VKSLPDLLQSSSVIGSAIQEAETVSVKSLVSKINVEGVGGGGLWGGGMKRKGENFSKYFSNLSS